MTGTVARAVMARGAAPSRLEVEIPDPAGNQVLVRIAAVGVCHTDLTLAAQWPEQGLPVILGHEGAGTVEALGPEATGLAVGERVCLTFDSCGACEFCAGGTPGYCDQAITRNYLGIPGIRSGDTPVTGGFFGQSSFAGYALATDRNVIPIGELPFELAAPLGCSVQTGVGTVTRALRVQPGESVVVFGTGAVGLAAVMGAVLAGATTIVAVDPRADRRELALQLGATHAVEAGPQAAQQVIEATGGGAHAAVDTTARPEVLAQAVLTLRPRGSLAVVGLGAASAELPVMLIMTRGLRVIGVIEGDSDPAEFLPELARAVADGRLPVDRIVTTFTDFDQAWVAAKEGTAVKPVWIPKAG
ncbi:Alcohol dehydrogenase zinc-binding domain protein OS=Tsukamurella paurometabola (strain ATCC 8368/ DSM / CCUG 35730 / CIP 100753 / JCM 10117 / KCTC 9821/ NBRC 16120 / NCIMB 702349 / NCTC 13040) OX=521096 GN=Tpau_2391 PE=3 SV=1 [Tsukamurella paurometabola]|uniref:Alcohol dehydrogenase zinc-binding domain protein n=1 Tax=Tsukamurella paurometabola (strain ATCC 8368 / DSM 20162 / CCUG 35730 / CIP 100753 / JCM 10117 / KCTC 9821 / NBRC 16120 / NCIMB 702349 / NCTC 13040) TaxID=521096 RepID=D5UR08_TSUPD|nr:NAD(P)-dependent alcohol dehydrogenase [Tsukamurella paurometabola]ADG78997.1 Alcohol dehydrogenase zinc-binding domain protein [Tsukamurella paurometabola DSM 20162]SUP33729.1 Aryl-alcohol dehydrogenase [Tsukamurella paurometabola]